VHRGARGTRAAGLDQADVPDARAAIAEVGLPFIVRPAFTLGGTGGGIAWTADELPGVVAHQSALRGGERLPIRDFGDAPEFL